MKGIYKALLALLLASILLALLLLLTLAHWLPGLAGIWLPQGTRIAMEASPTLRNGALVLPDLRYLAGDCELARVKDARLSHPSRWRIRLASVQLNPDCISKIPATDRSSDTPLTLEEWQKLLPNTWLTVDKFSLTPWPQFAGKLRLALTPGLQQLSYESELLSLDATIKGQSLNISRLQSGAFGSLPPMTLAGEITLPLVPTGLPTAGNIATRLRIPQEPHDLDARLQWEEDEGALTVTATGAKTPLLSLPWSVSQQRVEINGGQWRWPYADFPLSGGLAMRFDAWQQGLEKTIISGRLNLVTEGKAGKGNVVLTIGPGKLNAAGEALPLRLTGEARRGGMIFYARLPGELRGTLTEPELRFLPGALLRSRGRIVDAMNIDEIRWPLAGVKLSRAGVDGRLQAIMRAHENKMGAFALHLDGKASNFLPDSGLWQWRYWGKGSFTPLQAQWDVKGLGEWRDSLIKLDSLSTGFDKLQYESMLVSQPRLSLEKPLLWQRHAGKTSLVGDFALHTETTTFSGIGSSLPPALLKFSVKGKNLSSFTFKGDLRAGAIGPVRLNGRWDGTRLRGNAWWPKQSLTVFQPLVPPGWKMTMQEGELYAQVAFSAAAGQGIEAGGHGVVSKGRFSMPDSKVKGVDFVLPFRLKDTRWHLGRRGPVTLRIAEVDNQIAIQKISADLEGWYPWSEKRPLLLSNVSAEMLDGKIIMQQLRMPQHDPALLRLQNLSSSKLITAINPKQFTVSGRINGGLPLWLNHPRWIIKNGWLTNPGPMTFRLDKDMADAIAENNMAAGTAINWLRYMEVSRSWTRLDLDNLGRLTMRSTLTGNGRVEGKNSTVNLNYTHQENLFTLWRSLRFGDKLQSWLQEHTALPYLRCGNTAEVCEDKP